MDKKIIVKSEGGIPLLSGSVFTRYEDGVAKWDDSRLPKSDTEILSTTHFGVDDGLGYREGGCPISKTDVIGDRGEAVYTVGTVYTDIVIDCERDPAYDYGLHLKGGIAKHPEYYKDRPMGIEIWMIRGQDGRAYVYGEVTDPEIVVNDQLIAFKPHYCDSLHPYVEFGNYGVGCATLGLIVADDSGKYLNRAPSGCKVKMTDSGFKFEYAFTKRGKLIMEDEFLNFGFYYNDTNEFVDMNNYQRSVVKLPSRINPQGSEYLDPNPANHDVVIFTEASATGAFAEKDGASIPRSGDMLADMASGALKVAVIFPANASGHTIICARELASIFRKLEMRAVAVSAEKANESEYDVKIYVDCAGDPLSDELNSDVKYNGFGLAFGDGAIAIAGRREDALHTARGLLLSALEYVMAGGKTSEIGKKYVGFIDEIVNAPEMDGLTAVTDAGNGAYLLLKQDASPEDFDAYAAKLTAAGYSLYTENTMVSVRCATYVSDSAIVNLTYGSVDRSLRAVVDQRNETELPMLAKEEYTPVCKSFITQLAPSKVNMMTYIVKQDNGEYFIIDAGGNGAQQYIFDRLMEMSGGEDVVVSSWIFTHFHCDHIGGFIELCDRPELLERIKVKSVILNFPQRQVIDTASAFDHKNISRWQGIMEKCGAKVYLARTGQKYYFGNVELEMLFTYEDLMPFFVLCDRTNPTSHIFSMKIEGQRFIMTGDACGEATRLVAKRYGEGLRAEFVQFPHHGMGDGSTAREFYECIDAPVTFHPGYERFIGNAEIWARDNSVHYFLNSYEDTTLALPFEID